MNNNEAYLEQIHPTPKLRTKRCRLLAKLLTLALRYASFLIAFVVWIEFDFFFALVALALSYLLTGIVRSKMRTLSIPFAQLEYNYSDEEIATWYSAKRLCFEKFENSPLV